MLAVVQDEYNTKLKALRCDKEIIQQKTEEFQISMFRLQEQLEDKTADVSNLRGDLDAAYQKIGEL